MICKEPNASEPLMMHRNTKLMFKTVEMCSLRDNYGGSLHIGHRISGVEMAGLCKRAGKWNRRKPSCDGKREGAI